MKVNLLNELGEDRSKVVDLLFKSFEVVTSKDHFIDFINDVPYKKFIVVKDKCKCVGVLCLLDRNVHIKHMPIKTTWISYMAVDSSYKSFKITNLLKEALFQYSKKNSILTIGVARKALDGYWYPYGFLGATNFSELHIDSVVTPKAGTDYIIGAFENNKVNNRLLELYSATYVGVSGSVVRDEHIWKYYLIKTAKQGIELKCVVKESIIIGYFLFKGNKVLEVFGTSNFIKNAHQIINSYITSQNNEINKLVYEIGLSHPMIPYITKYNYSVTQRFAWNGGHIARIESALSLLKILLPIIEERLIKNNVSNFELFISNIKFSYRNKTLVLSKEKNITIEKIDKQDWIKIIFGISSLKRFDFVESNDKELVRLIFNNLYFQIPFLDQ